MNETVIHPPDSAPGAEDAPAHGSLGRVFGHALLVLTLRCERADLIRLRSQYGESDWSERLAERLHRLICHTCRRSRKQTAVVDAGLRGFGEREMR